MWSDQGEEGKSLDVGPAKVDISRKEVQHTSCFGRYSGKDAVFVSS